MWISPAFAQDAAKPAAGGDFLTGILPLIDVTPLHGRAVRGE